MRKYPMFSVFVRSFLYFFGLCGNPMDDIIDRRRDVSDGERIAGDWRTIGNDIRNSYNTIVKGISGS